MNCLRLRFSIIIKFLIVFLIIANCYCSIIAYNYNPTSKRDQTWMSNLQNGLPIRFMSILGTQISLGFQSCPDLGGYQQRQVNSLQVQL